MALKLNDFEGFNRYLFSKEEPNWKTFYDKETDTFTPPIGNPITEAEHQLNHYALWMVISHFALRRKPDFKHSKMVVIPECLCYACEWKPKNTCCVNGCPLIGILPGICTPEWDTWSHIPTSASEFTLSHLAKQIAMTPWREVEGRRIRHEPEIYY